MKESVASDSRQIDIPELKKDADMSTTVHDPDRVPRRVNDEVVIVKEEQIVYLKAHEGIVIRRYSGDKL